MTRFHAGLAAIAAVAALAAPTLASAEMSEADRELAAENFMQADADADGRLTLPEFEQLIALNAEDDLGRARLLRRFGREEMAFRRIDGNADGAVTPEEMRETAEQAQAN